MEFTGPTDSPRSRHAPDGDGARGLIIGTPAKATLTKAQLAFNRLVRKIEKLRRDAEVMSERMGRLLAIYTKELHPLEVEGVAYRKTIVRRLSPFLKSPDLRGRRRREALRILITEQLSEVLLVEGEFKDEDIRALADEMEAMDARQRPESDPDFLESLRRDAEEEFRAMGIDVDLSKFRPGMSPEEFLRELGDVGERLQQSEKSPGGEGDSSGRRGPRETRRKQRERLEEELRQRDLASLYKQLAKLLHPDLEPDPVLRLEKEAAMKLLTTAYKEKDLHALLRLELEWICREQTDTAKLTEEKLRVYNSLLKEQVVELERAVHAVAMHPRFSPLHRFAHPVYGPAKMDPGQAQARLIQDLATLRMLVASLEGPGALSAVRALIQEALEPPRFGTAHWY